MAWKIRADMSVSAILKRVLNINYPLECIQVHTFVRQGLSTCTSPFCKKSAFKKTFNCDRSNYAENRY